MKHTKLNTIMFAKIHYFSQKKNIAANGTQDLLQEDWIMPEG